MESHILLLLKVSFSIRLKYIFRIIFCFSIAVDHVNREVIAFSNALTVDTTPPVGGNIVISAGHTGYVTGHLKGHWKGFEDKESGIASYQWCIGSGRGHDDAITCSHTTQNNFVTKSLETLYAGQVYYITVKVKSTNRFIFNQSDQFALGNQQCGSSNDNNFQRLYV